MSKNRILKNTGFILIVIFIIFSAFFIYFSIPSPIILGENSTLSVNTIPIGSFAPRYVSTQGAPVITNNAKAVTINSESAGEFLYDFKIFNSIPVKQVGVSVVKNKYVIPSGETVGVKMYTDGLLIVKISPVIGADNREYTPLKDAGIEKGDIILSVDGKKVCNSEDFSECINTVSKECVLEIKRNDKILKKTVFPIVSNDNNLLKIGAWVRDSTAGIGTLTYLDPENNTFAALGHAITDPDTKSIMSLSDGKLTDCDVLSINKGKSGTPGEILGAFGNKNIGTITKNEEFGIYGNLEKNTVLTSKKAIKTATRFEIKEGPASILSDIDQNGVCSYDVEIVKVSKNARVDNKGIIIKVTDPYLLEKTGGIVQGMSGSPIVQNGKLVGAVTHVFVNDPTRGYGIFIENMLAEAEKN